MAERTVLVSYRIPEHLKFSFDLACEKNDQTASQVIREMMRIYVQGAGDNIRIKLGEASEAKP